MEAVRNEIANQLESFYRITGKKPTHIDSHQHVHQQKEIKPVFLEFAKKLNVTLRGCKDIVKYCGDFYGQTTDSSPLHDSISISNLKKIIENLPDGTTELACHPGLKIEIKTMYKEEREKEVESLCDSSVRKKIEDEGVHLCDFFGIPF